MASHRLSENSKKSIKQYHIIDTQYWIDMFDEKRDVCEEIRKHVNSSHHHPIKLLIPQPVIGEFVVKSIEQEKLDRLEKFIKFLEKEKEYLDFPVLIHNARKISNKLYNKWLSPNDLYIISIGISYAKKYPDSMVIFYTIDNEILDEFTLENGGIHKYLKDEGINNFKISELS